MDSPTPGDAPDAYGEWFKSIPHGLHGHFEPLTKAFQNWMPSTLAYFDHPCNESARAGYSFEALRTKILFAGGRSSGPIAGRSSSGVSNAGEQVRRTPSTHEPKNYGVGMSTRERLIEEGHI